MINIIKPSRQEMIDAIYEKIANKDLSFGCRIMLKNQEIVMENQPVEYGTLENYEVVWSIIGRYWTLHWWRVTVEIEKIYFNDSFYSEEEVSDGFKEEFSFNEDDEEKDWNLEIIGHPVMIGDVMDYIENITLDKIYSYIWVKKEEIPDLILQKTKDAMMKIFPLWKQKRLPIEDQPDECIDFIYNLILCTKNIKT